MNHLLEIFLFGLLSGITGTGIGGLAAFFIKNLSNRLLGLVLEFPAGLMTAVVCFELVPEALKLGGAPVVFTGIVCGAAVIVVIENILKKTDFLRQKYGNTGLLRAGMLVAIGIAMHNLPEGFAVGSGFEASAKLGLTITAVIVIHDIPEGLAMAVPMKAGGFSGLKSFGLTLLSGMPMGIGALAGAVLGEVSRDLISACLGFAGGAMLYIVCGELVPESKRIYRGRLPSLGNVIGIICGIIISNLN